MKNKKILSRILALCSVAVLLFALALPCFADETEQVSSNADLWRFFHESNPDVIDEDLFTLIYPALSYLDISSVDILYSIHKPLNEFEFFVPDGVYGVLLDPGAQVTYEFEIPIIYGFLAITLENSIEPDYTYDISSVSVYANAFDGVLVIFFDYDGQLVGTIAYIPEDGSYVFSECEIDYNGQYYNITYDSLNGDMLDLIMCVDGMDILMSNDYLNGLTNYDFSCGYPSDFALGYTSGYIANRPDGVVPPAKSGLFGQLYYILSDAIYGENVVLGSTQDFALTLVTTLLVLCVVLLPVLLVVAIMFKLFRW